MARMEQDREDLLKEATALVERAELIIDAIEDPVVFGFRRDGCCSWYLGADCSFQFNTQNQLRRGFAHGQLIKAESHRLVGLERRRQSGEVQLVRHEWTDDQIGSYLTQAGRKLDLIQNALANGEFRVVGQVPNNCDVLGRIRRWLSDRPRQLEVAASPHAR